MADKFMLHMKESQNASEYVVDKRSGNGSFVLPNGDVHVKESCFL